MSIYEKLMNGRKAYYCNSIAVFIKDDPAAIVGHLVKESFQINK